jgi:hypothetical protein
MRRTSKGKYCFLWRLPNLRSSLFAVTSSHIGLPPTANQWIVGVFGRRMNSLWAMCIR